MSRSGAAAIAVGSPAVGVAAEVEADGAVRRGSIRLGWQVRGADGWLVPGTDVPVRRSRPHPAPIVQTALRVARGDAVERVYTVGHREPAAVVVEVENASPDAVAVGFVIDAPGAVSVTDTAVLVDGDPVLSFSRRAGAIEEGRRVVFPVPHRTSVRVALVRAPDVDVRALPDAAAVERAWDALLDRGLRTELPEPLQSEVDSARADLLLAGPSAETFVALETWGFDTEAVEMWSHLNGRARRRARRGAGRGSGVLGEVRDALVHDDGRTVDLVPGFRAAWLGHALAAHDVPLRRGPCSFALRWHGARPALLWDVPTGATVRASALDPRWSSTEPRGETLLAEPPTSLLPMGPHATARAGDAVDAPDQFS